MMRAILALVIAGCVAASVAAQTAATTGRAILVGRVDRVTPAAGSGSEAGKAYDLDVIVLKMLSGKDPGEYARIRVTTDDPDIEGLMIVLLIDPDLKLDAPGHSWWSAASISEPVCVPAKLVSGEAHKAFVAKSFEQNGKRCVRL
jgi:hypothetical protein